MGLNSIDFSIIAVYLLGITLFGLRFRKRQLTLRAYFFARRDIPLSAISVFEGGLAAVIWTDVVQTAIYVGGTLVGVATIVHYVAGGWSHIHQIAAAGHKLRIFDFSPTVWKPYTFWAGLIGGTFFTIANHGTDQLIVQRLLAARNQRQSALALVLSGIAIFSMSGLFLVLGVMLLAYCRLPSAHSGKADWIYP